MFEAASAIGFCRVFYVDFFVDIPVGTRVLIILVCVNFF